MPQLVERIARYLFGADVFISYSRVDAFDYAGRLSRLLSDQGIRVFVDQAGAPPGHRTPPAVIRAAQRAAVFVLLASPGASGSPHVREEIEAFPSDRRALVPVLFGDDRAAVSHAWFLEFRPGLPLSWQPQSALAAGRPTDAILERITLAVGNDRQATRIRRAGIAATTLLAGAVVIAGLLSWQLRNTIAELGAKSEELQQATQEASRESARLQTQLASERKDLKLAQTLTATQGAELAEVQRAVQQSRQQLDALQDEYIGMIDEADEAQEHFAEQDVTCLPGQLPRIQIYFWWDRSDITRGGQRLLKAFADCYARSTSKPSIMLEGHMGKNPSSETRQYTAEFALALGDRRAVAVKQYLVSLGLPAEKLTTASKGKEQPFSTRNDFLNNVVHLAIYPP